MSLSVVYHLEELITEKIEKERWTYKHLSVYLKSLFPAERGLSVRSLERYEPADSYPQSAGY